MVSTAFSYFSNEIHHDSDKDTVFKNFTIWFEFWPIAYVVLVGRGGGGGGGGGSKSALAEIRCFSDRIPVKPL